MLSFFHGAGGRQQGGANAKTRIAITAAVAIVAALAAAASVRAGNEKIAFPNDYAKGLVYKSEDRPDNKRVRELFITREAVESVRRGAPLPSGTVITSVRYAAQLDAQGNPCQGRQRPFRQDRSNPWLHREGEVGPAGVPNIPRRRATASGSIGFSVPTKPPTQIPSTMAALAATSRRRARITCLLTTASKPRHAERSSLERLRRKDQRWITPCRRRAA